MSQLRTVREARINFIFFQDIITCVMGILILVTLMLSLSLGDESGTPEEEQLKSQLEKAKATLAQTERENRAAEQQALQLASLPDRVALEAEVSMLKRALAQASDRLRESQAAAAATSKTKEDRASAEREKSAAVEQQIAELENELAAARDQLAAARVDTNSVYIIPAADAQDRRKPVALIVSNDKIELRPFSGGRAQEVSLTSGADLRPVLAALDPARQYIIFYFRPSGAKWFLEFRRLARFLGFTVGYDAVEEQQQLVFPTNSPGK